MKPLVSCLMPTYNRAPHHLHLVEEAVESFLRQDYPNKELVILNDTPGQRLVCHADGVRVVNVDKRIASLGEKRNKLCRLASGDLFAPWDDDDISLPHRLSQAVERLCQCATEHGIVHHASPQHHYFNPQRSWWLHGQTLHHDHSHGYCHNASIFTRAAWAAVGGYPAVSGSEDAEMDGLLRRLGPLPPRLPDQPSEWSYVYRWGVSPCHLSGIAGGPTTDPHAPHYASIGQRPTVAGEFWMRPHWRDDYTARCVGAC
jgi:glycosyltransferase involved in cell wall biosynthesis